jgi:hypothetical protein
MTDRGLNHRAGLRLCHSVARSYACASASTVDSANGAPAICRPQWQKLQHGLVPGQRGVRFFGLVEARCVGIRNVIQNLAGVDPFRPGRVHHITRQRAWLRFLKSCHADPHAERREERPIMSAREAVAKAYPAVAASFQRDDADTIARRYTDDAELFIPGAPVIEGKEAMRSGRYDPA